MPLPGLNKRAKGKKNRMETRYFWFKNQRNDALRNDEPTTFAHNSEIVFVLLTSGIPPRVAQLRYNQHFGFTEGLIKREK